MPKKHLFACEQFCKYTLQAGDTLNYISGLLMRDDAFLALGDTAAIYRNCEKVRRLYLKRGMKAEAAGAYVTAITIALEKQQLDSARVMMQIFEQESGLFDEQGNIVPNREIYYYYKGMYYLSIHDFDSAEEQFRRLLKYNGIIIDGYRGLIMLFQQKQEIDSTFKYTRLHENALADYLKKTQTTAIVQAKGMYDYSHQQKLAQKQRQRANAIWIIWIVTIITAILFFFALHKKQMAKQREKNERINALLTNYLEAQERIRTTQTELEILEKHLQATESTAQKLLQDKEDSLNSLKAEMEGYSKELNLLKNSEKLSALLESDIVRNLHEISVAKTEHKGSKTYIKSPRSATLQEWMLLQKCIKQCLPLFYARLTKDNQLSHQEFQVCMLVRLGFTTSEIALLTDTLQPRISKVKALANEKLFGEKEASKLARNLNSI